jgi:hypothetical protein
MRRQKLPLLIANGFAPFPLPEYIFDVYRDHGHFVRVMPFRFANMRNVVTYGNAIATEAKLMLRRYTQIHFVGFSMGGVAGLYAMKHLGISDHVSRFLVYGAPFHGAALSYIGLPSGIFSKVCSQLKPNSAFLRELHAIPLSSGTRYVSAAGSKDWICPARTNHLAGAHNIVLPHSHHDIVTSVNLHTTLARLLE